MKGKLVKREDHWALYNEDGHKIAATIDGCYSKLSLKNCESITNGYDLDELINRAFDNMGYHSTVTPHEEKQFKLGYRVAFREALEILGDKKFSEDDVKLAIEYGIQSVLQAVPGVTSAQSVLDSYKQSLQQTEWDVEIEMNIIPELLKGSYPEEKLDDNGCLILRRI